MGQTDGSWSGDIAGQCAMISRICRPFSGHQRFGPWARLCLIIGCARPDECLEVF